MFQKLLLQPKLHKQARLAVSLGTRKFDPFISRIEKKIVKILSKISRLILFGTTTYF